MWLLTRTLINWMLRTKVEICVICVVFFVVFFFLVISNRHFLAITNRHRFFALRPWPDCITHKIWNSFGDSWSETGIIGRVISSNYWLSRYYGWLCHVLGACVNILTYIALIVRLIYASLRAKGRWRLCACYCAYRRLGYFPSW